MPYQMDCRRAVAAAHDESGSSAGVAEQFGCSESWVRRLMQHLRARGSPEPRSTARHDDQRTYDDRDERAIRKLIGRTPDLTLAEVAAAIGKPAHTGTVSRTLARMKLPRKKKSTHAAEQDRPDIAAARATWFEQFAGVRVKRLVFLDEFGATTTMQRTHGRAPPGVRVVSEVPQAHWKTVSTIAAMGINGIVAATGFEGATNTEVFVAFVRDSLAPVLKRGQVLVLDNLSAHASPEVDRLVGAAGASVARPPAYSPDFNPIEPAISKVKSIVKGLARRTVAGVLKGIAAALELVTPTDANNFMAHFGCATKRR